RRPPLLRSQAGRYEPLSIRRIIMSGVGSVNVCADRRKVLGCEPMDRVGGVIGAVVGLVVVIVPIEWLDPTLFSDSVEWVITVIVAAAGWLVGSRAAQRIRTRKTVPR